MQGHGLGNDVHSLRARVGTSNDSVVSVTIEEMSYLFVKLWPNLLFTSLRTLMEQCLGGCFDAFFTSLCMDAFSQPDVTETTDTDCSKRIATLVDAAKLERAGSFSNWFHVILTNSAAKTTVHSLLNLCASLVSSSKLAEDPVNFVADRFLVDDYTIPPTYKALLAHCEVLARMHDLASTMSFFQLVYQAKSDRSVMITDCKIVPEAKKTLEFFMAKLSTSTCLLQHLAVQSRTGFSYQIWMPPASVSERIRSDKISLQMVNRPRVGSDKIFPVGPGLGRKERESDEMPPASVSERIRSDKISLQMVNRPYFDRESTHQPKKVASGPAPSVRKVGSDKIFPVGPGLGRTERESDEMPPASDQI
jgi:hypothetical protein